MNKSLGKKIYDNKMFYMFFIPAFIFFAVFVIYPFVQGIIFSFQDYGILGANGFVGFENYKAVITDENFHQALINTAIFSFFTVILNVFVPLFVAIILVETIFRKMRTFLFTAIYIPKLLSTVVVVGIFANLLSSGGMISNLVMDITDATVAPNLMANPYFARTLYVIINVWRTIGYYVIMYSATLLAIDPGIYEAADIDGANWFVRVKNITIPSASGMMKTITLLSVMSIFKTFSLSFLLTTANNADKVITLMLYTYNVGINEYNIGMSVASATIVFVLTLLASLLVRKAIRY